MSSKKKHISFRFVLNLLAVLICTVVIIYFIFSNNGLRDLLSSDIKFNFYWLFGALICHILNMLCDIYLIYRYIRSQYKNFRFSDAVKTGLLGQFWGAVTPSSTGGQPMQIYYLSKFGISPGYSTSRLIQKFLVYQIVMTCLSGVAVGVNFNIFSQMINSSASVIFVLVGFSSQLIVSSLFVIFSFSTRLTGGIINLLSKILSKLKFIKNSDEIIISLKKQTEVFHSSNKTVYKDKKLFFQSIIVTTLQLLAIFTVPYCVYRGFGLSGASVFDMICGQSYVNLISGMMPIPGASGAAELGFVTLFSLFFTGETIKSATLVWRAITYYFTILVSVPFAYLGKDKKQDKAEEISEGTKAPTEQP